MIRIEGTRGRLAYHGRQRTYDLRLEKKKPVSFRHRRTRPRGANQRNYCRGVLQNRLNCANRRQRRLPSSAAPAGARGSIHLGLVCSSRIAGLYLLGTGGGAAPPNCKSSDHRVPTSRTVVRSNRQPPAVHCLTDQAHRLLKRIAENKGRPDISGFHFRQIHFRTSAPERQCRQACTRHH